MALSLSLAFGQAQVCVTSRALLNAFTVDVDRLGSHGEGPLHLLLDLLGEAGARGTFFLFGSLAERQPTLVRRIQRGGHQIGSQGGSPHRIRSLSHDQFRQDLRRSRHVLEDCTGKPVTVYRAPHFSVRPKDLWALDVLIEEGYTLDSSIYPARPYLWASPLEPYRLERQAGHIWEFPPVVWSLLGWPLAIAGRAFRFYPYALSRRLLHGINASDRPFAFYLRPGELKRPGVVDRLRLLLHDFVFSTLSHALDRLAGESVLPTHSFSRAA